MHRLYLTIVFFFLRKFKPSPKKPWQRLRKTTLSAVSWFRAHIRPTRKQVQFWPCRVCGLSWAELLKQVSVLMQRNALEQDFRPFGNIMVLLTNPTTPVVPQPTYPPYTEVQNTKHAVKRNNRGKVKQRFFFPEKTAKTCRKLSPKSCIDC